MKPIFFTCFAAMALALAGCQQMAPAPQAADSSPAAAPALLRILLPLQAVRRSRARAIENATPPR